MFPFARTDASWIAPIFVSQAIEPSELTIASRCFESSPISNLRSPASSSRVTAESTAATTIVDLISNTVSKLPFKRNRILLRIDVIIEIEGKGGVFRYDVRD